RFTTADPGYGIYAYEISRSSNEYFLGLTDAHTGALGKVYSEASAAGLAQAALLSDIFLRTGLESAVSATSGRGFGISAIMGYSDQRIHTGSHVDLEGASGLVTLAYNKKGTPLSLGVFGELFSGRYETSNRAVTPLGRFNVESEGDLESYGGGLFIQYRQRLAEALESGAFTIWIPGLHLEAVARAGYSRMDFATNAANPSQIDKNGGMYYGASLGGGYVFEPAPKFAVDLYGHGTWVRLAARDADDNLGQHIEFRRADSLRLVSGFRAAYALKERVRPYAGLAVDWETMGRPDVYINGYRADRADFSGVSGLLELGVGIEEGDSIFIDIKAAGSVGKRSGIGGLIELKYKF
ncbi:MAG: autotransporter outer membrane beta-barrel domain-containing protein, partial [Syntrophobacterales bacterium]|nr:autotransporter outer membrane beta-barrel domain-containing protein [Syntrophobacterales bacterium]